MRKLELNQMENLFGGAEKLKNADDTGGLRPLNNRDYGCALAGLTAGIASGFNPLIGALATASCYLLN